MLENNSENDTRMIDRDMGPTPPLLLPDITNIDRDMVQTPPLIFPDTTNIDRDMALTPPLLLPDITNNTLLETRKFEEEVLSIENSDPRTKDDDIFANMLNM